MCAATAPVPACLAGLALAAWGDDHDTILPSKCGLTDRIHVLRKNTQQFFQVGVSEEKTLASGRALVNKRNQMESLSKNQNFAHMLPPPVAILIASMGRDERKPRFVLLDVPLILTAPQQMQMESSAPSQGRTLMQQWALEEELCRRAKIYQRAVRQRLVDAETNAVMNLGLPF